jgi:hypothetical protein
VPEKNVIDIAQIESVRLCGDGLRIHG